MKQKTSTHLAHKAINRDHKNARTSHQAIEKAGKKKMSFFGNRASRQSVRDEMIQDGLDLMQLETEMDEARREKEDEINNSILFSSLTM
ncbi:Uncharacterised protein [Legionella steigerwaltii]|uniref:Uncharacterized protein n=1 Tax=Legionella steigerwaltii TaxID=460 RepID=A0A378L491_9GAMM|nr:hypothetical protein [Legionella steigerwaltii]KTD75409.1 hypothetical protein Lstg_2504 [Legionella steigerwaltii]STY21497.1 Uncharacterised protein [Legionella steigerwaltii]